MKAPSIALGTMQLFSEHFVIFPLSLPVYLPTHTHGGQANVVSHASCLTEFISKRSFDQRISSDQIQKNILQMIFYL